MTYPNDPVDQVREGMEVYSSGGELVGVVGEIAVGSITAEAGDTTTAEERAFFQVLREQGAVLYLPGTVVESVAENRVTLRLEHDDRELDQYAARPRTVDQPEDQGERDLTTTLL